jgi:hypothetical protein
VPASATVSWAPVHYGCAGAWKFSRASDARGLHEEQEPALRLGVRPPIDLADTPSKIYWIELGMLEVTMRYLFDVPIVITVLKSISCDLLRIIHSNAR